MLGCPTNITNYQVKEAHGLVRWQHAMPHVTGEEPRLSPASACLLPAQFPGPRSHGPPGQPTVPLESWWKAPSLPLPSVSPYFVFSGVLRVTSMKSLSPDTS